MEPILKTNSFVHLWFHEIFIRSFIHSFIHSFTLIIRICDNIQLLGRRTFNAFLLCFRALMLMQKRPSEKDCQPHLGLVNPQIADHRCLREVRSSTASKHSRDRFMSVFEYLFNVLLQNIKMSKLGNPKIADHRRLREVRSSNASKHSRDRFMSVFEYLFNVLFWNLKVSKSIEVVSSYYS